jgi:transcription factor IIIB 90 kDa subunit
MAPVASAPKPRAGVKRKIQQTRTPGFGVPTGLATFRASTPARSPTPAPNSAPVNATLCPYGHVNSRTETANETETICIICGALVEFHDNLVAETQFAEGPGGQVHAQGVSIGAGETHRASGAIAYTGRVGGEAKTTRSQAQKAAEAIHKAIGGQLNIPSEITTAATNLFGAAYVQGFVRGRSIDDVAVVCLYFAVRQVAHRQGGKPMPVMPLMLIDLAQGGDMDVFALGKMYHDFCKKVFFTDVQDPERSGKLLDDRAVLPGLRLAPGPELLVPKFVDELEFPSHAQAKIKADAYQIISSMRRDWITRGRRPAGICGAAVILAARMNNYRRTVREVVLVAKVTEITLNKRLHEFSSTNTSKSSVSTFRKYEFPSTDEDLMKNSDLQNNGGHQERYKNLPEAMNPPVTWEKPPKRRRIIAGAPETAAEIEGQDDNNAPVEEPASKRSRVDEDGFAIPERPASSVPPQTATSKRRGRPKGSKNWRAPPPTPQETALEQEIENDIGETMPEVEEAASRVIRAQSESAQSEREQTPSGATPGASSAISASQQSLDNTSPVDMSPDVGADEFEDDPDVATCVLNEEERRLKELLWVNENADWLRQDNAKRHRRELRNEELAKQGTSMEQIEKEKKARGRRRKDGSRVPGRPGDVSYLHDPEYQPTAERRGTSLSSAHSASADGSRGSGSMSPEPRFENSAALAVSRMLAARRPYSRKFNPTAVNAIYSLPTDDTRSNSSRSSSRASSILSEAGRFNSDTIATTSAQRRGRIKRGLPENEDRSDIIFGGLGGKNTGLARSQASLSAERRQIRVRDQSRASGSPSTTPNPQLPHRATQPRQASEDYEESVNSMVGSPTPPPTQVRTVTFAKSPPEQRSAPTSNPTTPVSATSGSLREADAGTEEVVEDEAIGERSLIREVAPPGAFAGEDEDEDEDEDDDDEDDDFSDEDEADVDPEDALQGRYAPRRAWDA